MQRLFRSLAPLVHLIRGRLEDFHAIVRRGTQHVRSAIADTVGQMVAAAIREVVHLVLSGPLSAYDNSPRHRESSAPIFDDEVDPYDRPAFRHSFDDGRSWDDEPPSALDLLKHCNPLMVAVGILAGLAALTVGPLLAFAALASRSTSRSHA